MATYYVTQGGGSPANGTSLATAWSIATFNAGPSPLPTGGDTVIFSGTISTGVTVSSSGTGIGASRLNLDMSATAAGTTQVILGTTLTISSKNHINLFGGTTSPTGIPNSISAITLSNCTDVTIDHWTFNSSDSQGWPVFISPTSCTTITISNCTATNTGYGIIGDNNTTVTITGCLIVTSLNGTSNVGNQTDVIHLGSAQNVTITKNKFVNKAPGNAAAGSDGSFRHNDLIQTYQAGAGHALPTNWIVSYNWLENQQVPPASDGNCSWFIMQDMTGNPALQIYGNIILGTGTASANGLFVNRTGAAATVFFYNNTLVRNPNPPNMARFLADSGPMTLFARNNAGQSIPATGSGNLTWTAAVGATWDYNFFFNMGDNSATPSTTSTHGSLTTDPKFTNASGNVFTLQPTSPLIGAADSSIGATYNQGLDPSATFPNPLLAPRANPTTGKWDVGAFVLASSGSPTNISLGSIPTGEAFGGASVTGGVVTSSSLSFSSTATFSLAQTNGNTNVVVIGWKDTTTNISSVTDTSGNTYSPIVGPLSANGVSQAIYMASNIAAAQPRTNTVTVVFSAAPFAPDVRISEYSGVDHNNPVDVFAQASGTGPTASVNPATSRSPDILIVGEISIAPASGAGSGFILRPMGAGRNMSADQNALEDQVLSSSGSASATVPISTANANLQPNWIIQALALAAPPASTSSNVNLTSIPSAESFGSSQIDAPANIALTSIPLTEAFGSDSITAFLPITLSSISSAEAFGAATVHPLNVNVGLSSIGSAEAFGQYVIGLNYPISLTSIGSAEAFGSSTITAQAFINLQGIQTAEAFGATTVNVANTQLVILTAIPSGEAFGSTTVVPTGAAQIALTGIPSAQAFGNSIVSLNTIVILLLSIPSAEIFGATDVKRRGGPTRMGRVL